MNQPDQLASQYVFVLGFIVAGVFFAVLPLAAAYLISPRSLGRRKYSSYESGMEPIGQAWIQFGVSYYLYALIFLAFDVDVLYLFPVLTVYGSFPWRDLIEITIFVGILSLAIVYAWVKGVFQW